jgi:hypothetical protein
MTERETEILAPMLDGDDPALKPLRAQAAGAMVRSGCGCGCATIDFDPGALETLPSSPVACFQLHATSRESLDAAGADPWGVILFVDEGRLKSLELVWHERPIDRLPPATDLDVLASPF